ARRKPAQAGSPRGGGSPGGGSGGTGGQVKGRSRPPPTTRRNRQCRRFEIPAPYAASPLRNFKSKSGTRIIELLVPFGFLSSYPRCRAVLRTSKTGRQSGGGRVAPAELAVAKPRFQDIGAARRLEPARA